MKRFLVAVISILVLVTGLNANAAFSDVFVVGDSLSDNGNAKIALETALMSSPFPFPTNAAPPWDLIPSQPYSQADTFSDGPVWVDQLAQNLTGRPTTPSFLGGTNYAFGGARTGNRANAFEPLGGLDQLGLISLAHDALPDDALYVVWLGGNDLRDAARAADAGTASTIISDAINNIGTIIGGLASIGATDFLVPNTTDLGLTPEADLATTFGLAPYVQDASAISNQFNSALAATIASLESTLPINITLLDTFAAVNAIVADPTGFGFTDVDNPCLEIGAGGVCANPDQYLFWDGIHPTAEIQARTAALATAAVVPVPAALPLFLSAIGFFACWGRRMR
ncbi:MAG: SGNH/GDSL hydrolase family protein [Pseudomonadota bacterium]